VLVTTLRKIQVNYEALLSLEWTKGVHLTTFWKTELSIISHLKTKSCFQPRKAIVIKLSGQFFPSKCFPIIWRNWAHTNYLSICAFPSHTKSTFCWFWEWCT